MMLVFLMNLVDTRPFCNLKHLCESHCIQKFLSILTAANSTHRVADNKQLVVAVRSSTASTGQIWSVVKCGNCLNTGGEHVTLVFAEPFRVFGSPVRGGLTCVFCFRRHIKRFSPIMMNTLPSFRSRLARSRRCGLYLKWAGLSCLTTRPRTPDRHNGTKRGRIPL